MINGSGPPDDPLFALRQELDALDRELLDTAARRQRVVRDILAVKAQTGRSLFDRSRERAVFERARAQATAAGLDEALAHDLVTALVEASHRLQEAGAREAVAQGPSRRFCIVGGAGQMGQLLGGALRSRGHLVDVLEKDDGRDRPQAVAAAEIVMLAVPMAVATEVATELAPFVRDDALLCDINSLKAEICAVMEARSRGEVLGLHPMFGPTVSSLRRQKIVVCPVRPGPLAAWLQHELGALGAELVEAEPREHDRMMAVVQVLMHYRTVVMGEALRRTGVPVAESLRFTSPIYRLELAIVGRLFAQDPALYAEIEMANPEAGDVRRHFVEAAHHVDALISTGDRAAFEALFGQVAEYFSGFSDEAMHLSDFLIEALVRKP
jgi:chorismate mutase / prephenate dehydrogenase